MEMNKTGKMQEHISWAKWLELEVAGAHRMGGMNKTGKCRSTSVGRSD